MSNLILLDGIVANSAGLPRIYEGATVSGFPADGLADLLLFNDGAGAAPSNAISGRPAGAIEHPVATNNAFAWLQNGGLQLDGTEIVTMPQFDVSTPWSLVSLSAIVGSVGGNASERLTGLIGLKEFASAPVRGAAIYVRGTNDWNVPSAAPYYQLRPINNGANGTLQNLTPSAGQNLVGSRRIHVLSFDGASTLTGTVYDKSGAVKATYAYSLAGVLWLLSGGSTVSTLTPAVGLSSGTYSGGRQQVEAFARYNRVLTASDIQQIGAAAEKIGKQRGRYW